MRPGLLPVGVLAAMLSLLVVVEGPVLEVRSEGGEPLLREALSPGEPFVLSYYHSVNHAPVREVYALDADGAVRVLEHGYRTQGAGLGQVPGEGRVVEASGGWTRVLGLDRRVGSFALRVGLPGVDHRIEVRGRAVSLTERAAGERVWVGGRRVPMLRWILHRRPSAAPLGVPWEMAPALPQTTHLRTPRGGTEGGRYP